VSADSQFRLLVERRFLPFFGTQALGAFNDNVFKNALVILATFHAASYTTLPPAMIANLSAGLFILPFVLFSGLAGQLADRYDKTRVMQAVKAVEIAIMALAGIGFATHHLPLLLAALFLMGAHSTFFAPAKYGLLPQVLDDGELVGGNALIEMGTFVAILLGTLAAGVLAAQASSATDVGALVTSLLVVSVAGLAVSFAMPRAAPAAPGLEIDWNPWTSTRDNLRAAAESRVVFLAVLGNSWFWFYGAVILAQLPVYAKDVLHGSEQLVTWLLVAFTFGVGLGSMLCERLSGHRVEIGLVPLGSIGLTVFGIDLWHSTPAMLPPGPLDAAAFLAQPGAWRVFADLALIGAFGGFYVVPLYALIQSRAPKDRMSRVIGATSILNAVFMVAAAGVAAALLAAGLTIPQLLLVLALLNAAVAVYIYSLVPEFLLRFLAWILVRFIYRVRVTGAEHFPEHGPALVVCNHVAFTDPIVLTSACRRPMRFVMDAAIFRIPVLSLVFKGMKAIPVASAKEDVSVRERAFEAVAKELRAGQIVCIFPEGGLTPDGTIREFKPGVLRILKETPVPVIPAGVSGLWGSMFSRQRKEAWRRWPRRFLSRIEVRVGPAIAPDAVTLDGLHATVSELRGPRG
jgi:1-acyl-sn-glycerol-3-phosphate acyltransferase